MKLLDKVKKRLEENYGIDFLSEFWTDDQIVLLEDIVEATEKEVNNINYMQCCKSDSEQLLFSPEEIEKVINDNTVLNGEHIKTYFLKK